MRRSLLLNVRFILGGLALSAASQVGPTAAAADTPRYPADAILLFVASWCAPCHAELARLPEIRAAARPRRVLVVAFDSGAATQAMLRAVAPAERWQPEGAERRAMETALYAETAGLPFALVTDARGRRCATLREGLDAARTRTLIARCPATE